MAGGIFGVSSKTEENVVNDLFWLMFYGQHLGQGYCGISYRKSDGDLSTTTHKGLVRPRFGGEISDFSASSAIGHTALKERQPLEADCSWGRFSLTFSGNIANEEKLRHEFLSFGHSFITNRSVEVLTKLIAQGNSPLDGIQRVFEKVEGAFALLMLVGNGIYAARSEEGQIPLILGEKENGFALSSTSTGFGNLGYTFLRDLRPGEIVLTEKGEIKTLFQHETGRIQFPTFRWIYGDNPASTIEGINTAITREKIGALLARESNTKADFVMGVPKSGIFHAIGYANESGLPYNEGLVKYEYADRSYTQPTAAERDMEANIKIIVIPELVRGKIIIVVDDSIVRATQMKMNLIAKLKAAGAKKIHLVIAFPPITRICLFDYSTRRKEELAMHKYGSEDGIKDFLGVDSLRFATREMVAEAIGKPVEELCFHCCF
jgi:amidophosphoribosyltransferase